MVLGDLNFIFIIFFILFTSIVLNVNTALHLLLTAELLWITLYILCLFIGLTFDNLNILSLTFFFLILINPMYIYRLSLGARHYVTRPTLAATTPTEGDVILVTGASGFLGQHIVKLLHQRATQVKEIRVLDTRPFKKSLGLLLQPIL